MKKGWEVKKLRDICLFKNGLWSGKKPPFTKVNVIRNTNFSKDGTLDDFDIACLDVERSQFEKRKLEYGDIILEKSGGGPKQPIGRVIVFNKNEGEYSFSNFTSLIRILYKEKVDFNFLHRYLHSIYLRGLTETMQSHSTGIRNLIFDDYKEIEIPIPPFTEQKRIVEVLDKAFAEIDKAKANAEKNIKNAKELFDSYLNGVFKKEGEGWEEKRLGDVCIIKPPKKEAKEKLKDTDLVTFLPMEDLGILNKDFSGKKEEKLLKIYKNYTYFADNDVLMAKITPCFENGKIGIARNLVNSIGFGSSEYIVFRANGNVVPDYLYYFLSSNKIREEGRKLMTGAVGHKRVSIDWIENYIIPFPKLHKKQQSIVQNLDKLSAETKKLEETYKKQIENLDELKKSILEKAFKGEL